MNTEIKMPVLGDLILVQKIRKTALGEQYLALENQKKKVLLTIISPSVSCKENFIVRFELLKQIWPKLKHPNIHRTFELSSLKNLFYITQEWIFDESSVQTLDSLVSSGTLNNQINLLSIFESLLKGIEAVHAFSSPLFREGAVCDTLNYSQIYISTDENSTIQLGHIFDSFLIFGEDPFRYLLLANDPTVIDNSNILKSLALLPPNARSAKTWTKPDSFIALGNLLFHLLTKSYPKGSYLDIKTFNPLLKKPWDSLIQTCLYCKTESPKKIWKEWSAVKSSLETAKIKSTPEVLLTPPEKMSLICCEEKVYLGATDGPLKQQPQFKAKIPPFFIDLTPVTVKELREFTPSYIPSNFSMGDNFPATQIPYKLAIAYCDFRSDKAKLPRGSFRLPTEYEWEAACRGGAENQYPWGNSYESGRAHLGYEKNHGAISVNKLPKGHFQLMQMLGNVWEWTSSIYKPHPFSNHEEKEYKADFRVIKGGSWWSNPSACRASMREGVPSHSNRADIGFRCVCEIPETTTFS